MLSFDDVVSRLTDNVDLTREMESASKELVESRFSYSVFRAQYITLISCVAKKTSD